MSISITCEWVEKASRDIRMAKLAINEEPYDEAAFHCQQAVEKALKTLLVAYRIKPPKTHSLERLLALLRGKVDVAWAYGRRLARVDLLRRRGEISRATSGEGGSTRSVEPRDENPGVGKGEAKGDGDKVLTVKPR